MPVAAGIRGVILWWINILMDDLLVLDHIFFLPCHGHLCRNQYEIIGDEENEGAK